MRNEGERALQLLPGRDFIIRLRGITMAPSCWIAHLTTGVAAPLVRGFCGEHAGAQCASEPRKGQSRTSRGALIVWPTNIYNKFLSSFTTFK